MYATCVSSIILGSTLATLLEINLVKIFRSQFVSVIGLQLPIFFGSLPSLGINVIVEVLLKSGNRPHSLL